MYTTIQPNNYMSTWDGTYFTWRWVCNVRFCLWDIVIPKVIAILLNKTIWPQAQEVTPLVDLKGLVTREDPCEGEIQPMEERTSHLVASIAQTAHLISIGIERNWTNERSININTTTTVAVNQISMTHHAWTVYQILFNKNLAVSDIMVHHWSKNISLRPCDT